MSEFFTDEFLKKQKEALENQVASIAVSEKERLQKMYDAGYQAGLNDRDVPAGAAYQKGLDDAWEAAKKISFPTSRGGLNCDDLLSIFGKNGPFEIMSCCCAKTAVEAISNWENGKAPQWLKDEGGTIRCSKCGNMSPFNKRYLFCPSCGADMGLK